MPDITEKEDVQSLEEVDTGRNTASENEHENDSAYDSTFDEAAGESPHAPKSLVKALQAYEQSETATSRIDKPMTRFEAAALLSVSVNTINRYLSDGTLQKIKLGKRLVRITPESVQILLTPSREMEAMI